MIRTSRVFQAAAIGFGLTLAVITAPSKVGAMDISGMGMRSMTGGTSATTPVQPNVSSIEANVLARVDAIRMNLLGR
jgi:hypothetical protein